MEMTGTALSISSLILGAVQGQLGSLVHKWLDYKYKIKSLKSETYLKNLESARNIKNERFQITRRYAVLLLVTTFCALHILPGITNIPMNLFTTDSNGPVFWPFYGSSTIKLIKVTGFVLTPELCYFTGLVFGLYCGKSDV